MNGESLRCSVLNAVGAGYLMSKQSGDVYHFHYLQQMKERQAWSIGAVAWPAHFTRSAIAPPDSQFTSGWVFHKLRVVLLSVFTYMVLTGLLGLSVRETQTRNIQFGGPFGRFTSPHAG